MLASAMEGADRIALRYHKDPSTFWLRLCNGRAGIEQMLLVHQVLLALEEDAIQRIRRFQREFEETREIARVFVET